MAIELPRKKSLSLLLSLSLSLYVFSVYVLLLLTLSLHIYMYVYIDNVQPNQAHLTLKYFNRHLNLTILSFSLRTTLCLQFAAQDIANAVLYLGAAPNAVTHHT